MIYEGVPMLSLVAQYDDLCRYTKVVTTGSENEFKIFVENQLNYFQSLKDTESEIRKLNERITNIEAEKLKLQTQIRHLANQCEGERSKRMQVEKEKSAMERQLAIIRDVLLTGNNNLDDQTREKLAFLNSTCNPSLHPPLATIEESAGSLFSWSDIDCTENDLENKDRRSSHRRSKKKKSRSKTKTSPKRKTSEDLHSDNDLYDENMNLSFKKVRRQRYNETESDTDEFKFKSYDLRSHNTEGHYEGAVGQFNKGKNMNQMHKFSPKTMMMRPDKCHVCRKDIGFFKQVLKCDGCKVVCHVDCQENCAAQCYQNSPIKGNGVVGSEDVTDIYATVVKSPVSIAAPKGTRLGPIYSGKKSFTSRNSKSRKMSEIQFSSPVLK